MLWNFAVSSASHERHLMPSTRSLYTCLVRLSDICVLHSGYSTMTLADTICIWQKKEYSPASSAGSSIVFPPPVRSSLMLKSGKYTPDRQPPGACENSITIGTPALALITFGLKLPAEVSTAIRCTSPSTTVAPSTAGPPPPQHPPP